MRKIVEYAETAHKEVAFIPVIHYEKNTSVSSEASIPQYYFILRRKSTVPSQQITSQSERSQKDESKSQSRSNTSD